MLLSTRGGFYVTVDSHDLKDGVKVTNHRDIEINNFKDYCHTDLLRATTAVFIFDSGDRYTFKERG